MRADEHAACRPTRERLDAYLSAELEQPDRHTVDAHLQVCPACAGERAARARLRQELVALLREDGDTAALEERILRGVEDAPSDAGRRRALLAAAAAVFAAVGVTALRRRSVPATAPVPAPVTPSPAGVPLDVSIYDDTSRAHLICAVQAKLSGKTPPRDEALAGLEGYRAALASVEAQLQDGARLLDAHVCRWPREFGHLVIGRGERRLSVLVTPEDAAALPPLGELYEAPGRSWLRALDNGGFGLALSADARHAVFVVSDEERGALRAFGLRLLPGLLQALSAPAKR